MLQDVFNGDLGVVVTVQPPSNGARSSSSRAPQAGLVRVRFPPRPGSAAPHVVDYEWQERCALSHAWATTVHKAQGGEFPVVVLVLPPQAGALVAGAWLGAAE